MAVAGALMYLLGCGAAPKSGFGDGGGRIIHGQDADWGEFPYLVSLTLRTEKRPHNCGGTIITKSWVLTAAHCCTPQFRCMTIYSGSIDRDSSYRFRISTRIIPHELFNETGSEEDFGNDICLVRVFPPFILGRKIRPVTLPTQDWTVPIGARAVTAGWGFTTPIEENWMAPDRMKKLEMVIIDNDECSKMSCLNFFHPGYLCVKALEPGQGTCKGDSGGPLLLNGVQIGVTSWLCLPCGSPTPDAFARLPLYINWIKDKLGSDARQLKFVN